jgi:hypothetical protein
VVPTPHWHAATTSSTQLLYQSSLFMLRQMHDLSRGAFSRSQAAGMRERLHPRACFTMWAQAPTGLGGTAAAEWNQPNFVEPQPLTLEASAELPFGQGSESTLKFKRLAPQPRPCRAILEHSWHPNSESFSAQTPSQPPRMSPLNAAAAAWAGR